MKTTCFYYYSYSILFSLGGRQEVTSYRREVDIQRREVTVMSVDTDKGIEEIPRDTDTLRHDCCLLVFTQQRLEDYCNIFVQLKIHRFLS